MEDAPFDKLRANGRENDGVDADERFNIMLFPFVLSLSKDERNIALRQAQGERKGE